MQKRLLCEFHFDDDAFVNPLNKKKLKSTAVPRHYKSRKPEKSPDLKVVLPDKTYAASTSKKSMIDNQDESTSSGSEKWVENLVSLPSSPYKKRKIVDKNLEIIKKQNSEIEKLKKKLELKTKVIYTQRSHIAKLKIALSKVKRALKFDKNVASQDFLKKWSATIIRMQLKGKRKQWLPDEKKFALMMHYKSPGGYKFLTRMITLPSVSTVRHWIGKSNYLPGVNQKLFQQIKLKMDIMEPFERKCTITFDEMSIKEHLEYNKFIDLIEGFEDYGEFGRSKKCAKYVLVFMARGILSSWKLPISYYFSNSGVSSGRLKNIVHSVLKMAFESGMQPQIIICDQGPQNQKLYRDLQINKQKPYFEYMERTIFALFDTLHLVKNFRNNLLNGNFLYKGNTISFEDIKAVYQLDKGKKSRALKKITDVHVNPSTFQRMNVKLATQVLSHTMASAIKTCIETGELISKSAKHTAEFVGKISSNYSIKSCHSIFSTILYGLSA